MQNPPGRSKNPFFTDFFFVIYASIIIRGKSGFIKIFKQLPLARALLIKAKMQQSGYEPRPRPRLVANNQI